MKQPDSSPRAALALVLLFAFALTLSETAMALVPDPTFNAPQFAVPAPAAGLLLLPDGRFLRFANVDTLVEHATGPLTRHFADGSFDSSFHFSSEYYFVGAALQLPDGKYIVAAARHSYGIETREELLRLNADGSLDATFPPVLVTDEGAGYARGLVLQPDGKILVSGLFTQFGGNARPGIVRLFPNGTLDTSFASVPLFVNPTGGVVGSLALDDVVLQPDGKIIIYGNFRRIDTVSFAAGVARLNSNGTVDQSFVPSGFTRSIPVRTAAIQSDGKIIIGGRFSVSASFAANPTGTTYSNLPFIRLNPDGSADQTFGYFDPGAPPFISMRDCVVQSNGKVVGSNTSGTAPTVMRFNTNGSLDGTFHQPVLQFRRTPPFAVPTPTRLALQPDGRLFVSGTFTDVDAATPGHSRYGVARLNSDGTVDSSFTTSIRTGRATSPPTLSTSISGLTLISFGQSDVGISGDAVIPNNFGRLLGDGSLDTAYQPFANPPAGAPLQGDFLAAGFVRLPGDELFVFGSKGAFGEFRYGRLLANSQQHPTFTADPNALSLFGSSRLRGALQGDRGVLLSTSDEGLASAQSLLNGVLVHRITFGGTLDPSFSMPVTLAAALVERAEFPPHQPIRIHADPRLLAVQSDGKILFVYFDSESTSRLVRLNADGALDSSFAAVVVEPLTTSLSFPQLYDPLTGVTLQPIDGVVIGQSVVACEILEDERLVISGPFRSINGTPSRGIARLHANGSLDGSFNVGAGPQWTSLSETKTSRPIVEQIAADGDGKLLLSGTFESFAGVTAPGIIRLIANGSVDPSFVAPATRNKAFSSGSSLVREGDGSFLLSGPYSSPGNTDGRPTVVRILGAPTLVSAASRKTHGSAGAFDINLPLTGLAAVECRNGGADGNYTLVINLNNPIASGAASVTSGSGSVAGAPAIVGKTMTIQLTGVTNAQTVAVTLQGVTDVGNQVLPNTTVSFGVLVGDTNGDRTVNSGDALQTRSRSGQVTDATNLRSDVNTDGNVNSGDTIAVRGRSGTSLP